MQSRKRATKHPNWLGMASFWVRSKGLQAQRMAENALRPLPSLTTGVVEDFPYVLAESVSQLYTSTDSRERPLVLGKIQNLRLACSRIHHRVLGENEVFSLWRQIGAPWRVRGFVRGREVREGCVIPTFGGGLCQLSGSMLEVILAMDLQLLERHAHTALPADVPSTARRDATLFWNYVDLCFRSPFPLLFDCFLSTTSLVVRLRGKQPRQNGGQPKPSLLPKTLSMPQKLEESCLTCAQDDCSRHVGGKIEAGKTAFLIDEFQPEFAELVDDRLKDGDQVLTPSCSDSTRNKSFAPGNCDVHSFGAFCLYRSLALRWAVARHITVAKVHFQLAGILAKLYERHLDYQVEHLIVGQTLIPHLWRSGALGGRTFDVLMQRLPVESLEQQLNSAANLYPQSRTLVEFRAPHWFREAERQALNAARTIFTPHPQIATIHERSVCLPWKMPARQNAQPAERDLLVFLGPTLARKGAHAVREAMRRTGLVLTVLGHDLEERDFWRDLPVARSSARELPWERVHTVVQPALFESWPRQLLKAHAAGANLVISPGCGIEENHIDGIYHVPFGDADGLSATLITLLKSQGDLVCAE